MRRLTTTFLVALLTFSVGFGTVAAKPKDDNPIRGNGNGAMTIPFKVSGETDPIGNWNCTGVYVQNQNRTRINGNCKIDNVLSYAGTYTSGGPVPGWLSDVGSGYLVDAVAKTGNDQLGNVTWQVTVTPNDNGTGNVNVVAILEND